MLAAMAHRVAASDPDLADPGPAMNDVVLVDDHILLSLLLGDEPRDATTGLWYHRLCPAPADKAVVESMSRQLGNVAPDIATEVIAAVMDQSNWSRFARSAGRWTNSCAMAPASTCSRSKR